MAGVLKTVAPPPLVSEPSDSEVDVASLCGSELELEMAWGEGPIAPLRSEAPADAGVATERSNSRGNGSGRARTPQKRSESPLQRSKRLINIHPIRSVSYLQAPNQLPVGVRKQQRWFNGAFAVWRSRFVVYLSAAVSNRVCRGRPPFRQQGGVDPHRGPHGAHANQRRVAVKWRQVLFHLETTHAF